MQQEEEFKKLKISKGGRTNRGFKNYKKNICSNKILNIVISKNE